MKLLKRNNLLIYRCGNYLSMEIFKVSKYVLMFSLSLLITSVSLLNECKRFFLRKIYFVSPIFEENYRFNKIRLRSVGA
jgi:hypothetical protein